MEFKAEHFDGMAYVPDYSEWVMNCDMTSAYAYHHRVLKLLQWKCPPSLWHLKTPVHMLYLDALVAEYPHAKFLWSHRDPASGAWLRVQPDRLLPHLGERSRRHGRHWRRAACHMGRSDTSRHRLFVTAWVTPRFADLLLCRHSVQSRRGDKARLCTTRHSVWRLTVTAAIQQWADSHKPGAAWTSMSRILKILA